MKGLIFNIQKFSIHDGPGIRTVVFFKGCPLKCLWCHNPEGQSYKKELVLWEERCIGCNTCLEVCPNSAVEEQEKCSLCGTCAEECPAEAREIIGKEMSVEEVMEEIEKDIVFYDESSGGVTFSGGEPLLQSEFLISILKKCKEKGISSTIETCGYSRWRTLLSVNRLTDLILYDLKVMDNESHRKFTGVSNDKILENLRKLSSISRNVVVRIPVIPGVNDCLKNIEMTADFVSSHGIKEVHLLPFHKEGVEKYRRLRRERQFVELSYKENDRISLFAEKLKKRGITVKIRG